MRFEAWLANWVDVVCSIISIITFTIWMPSWYLDIRGYFSKKRLNKRLKYENRKLVGSI